MRDLEKIDAKLEKAYDKYAGVTDTACDLTIAKFEQIEKAGNAMETLDKLKKGIIVPPLRDVVVEEPRQQQSFSRDNMF